METFSPPSAKFCSAPPPVPEGGTEQMTSTGERYGKVCPETIWISGGTCPMVRVDTSVSPFYHLTSMYNWDKCKDYRVMIMCISGVNRDPECDRLLDDFQVDRGEE